LNWLARRCSICEPRLDQNSRECQESVLAKSPCRDHYRIKTSGGTGRNRHTPYSASEIDFLVAYIFSEDLWYVFPASVVASQTTVCLWPGSKKSRFEQYREAWHLMDPPLPKATAECQH